MAEAQVPYSWVGQEVEAQIINAAGFTKYGLPTSLTAMYRIGTLEAVNDLGIVATLWYEEEEEEEEEEEINPDDIVYGQEEQEDEEDDEPISTFYPWSSVVWLRLIDEA